MMNGDFVSKKELSPSLSTLVNATHASLYHTSPRKSVMQAMKVGLPKGFLFRSSMLKTYGVLLGFLKINLL